MFNAGVDPCRWQSHIHCNYLCFVLQVAKTCAAALWGLAVSSEARQILLDLGAMDVLVDVARSSLTMPCIDLGVQEVYFAGHKTSHDQRDMLQVRWRCRGNEMDQKSRQQVKKTSMVCKGAIPCRLARSFGIL
jgi:hypothetical protein